MNQQSPEQEEVKRRELHRRALKLERVSSLPEWKAVIELLNELVEDEGDKLLRSEASPEKSLIQHARYRGMHDLVGRFEFSVQQNVEMARQNPFLEP